ncbi:MAG TPA: hypothetical protein VKW04_02935, partial [Planctomycetota bacterium]|nr:hypothetical protein [Planctomycetota bacterium]
MSRPSWAAALSALALLSGCGPPDAAMAGGRAVRTESPAGPRSVLPRLLLLDWFGSSPVATPATVRDHQAFLESGPFDGLALYLRSPDLATNITASVLGETRVAPADIDRVLEPLEALRFERLLHNYAAVQSQNPPDLFDDWTGVVWNFTQLARSARRVHLEGIVLDNENYGRRWADYPAGVAYPQKSLREYQDQAFLRGRQVMEGMTSVFPELSLLVLHGPYLSERRAPHPLFPDWERTNLLQGPFFAGLVDGAGAAATVIDGGELYHL